MQSLAIASKDVLSRIDGRVFHVGLNILCL